MQKGCDKFFNVVMKMLFSLSLRDDTFYFKQVSLIIWIICIRIIILFPVDNVSDLPYLQLKIGLQPKILRTSNARRTLQHCNAMHQTGAELETEEHMFRHWRMRSHRFRDVPSHLSSQAKVIVFSLSLI